MPNDDVESLRAQLRQQAGEIERLMKEREALLARVRELEQFKHHHRDCDAWLLSHRTGELDALRAELADCMEANNARRKDAEAGRKLWAYLVKNMVPWGEDQQEFVAMGLLKAVYVAPDTPEDERCANCEGDCNECYRPTDLLAAVIDAAIAAGEKL